jgi:Zn-dependent protease with chaperone function
MKSATSSMSILASDTRVIEGTYFDGRSARGLPACLLAEADGRCDLQMNDQQRPLDMASVKVSARIAHIPRRVDFSGGGHFETLDNDGIDALQIQHAQHPGLVQWFERQWKAALFALLSVVLVAVLFFTVGVPWLSQWVAEVLPVSADAHLGQGVLEVLDGRLLKPSALSASRQLQLQQRFDEVIRNQRGVGRWQLQLRDAPIVWANAFALPGGTVVMTDQLVALAQHDEELMAVLAHEVGHVRRRHGLRQLLQSLGVSAMAMAVFGDVTALSTFTGVAPALLQAGYSREMEREADAYSRAWMQQHGIAQRRFDDLVCRIAAVHGSQPDSKYNYFASHPSISERARCTQ